MKMREVLSNELLVLRRWRQEDADALVECVNGDDEVARWLDQVPQPYARDDALAYVSGVGRDAFAVTEAVTGRILGSVGAQWTDERDVAELGYWVRSDARGRGVTTSAVRLVARWAFAQGARRVQLRADVENRASRRVAEKAGFRLEGVLRSVHWNPRLGRRQDWAMYSLLPGELE